MSEGYSVLTVEQQVQLNTKAVNKLTEHMFGNGAEGMDERVRHIERVVTEIQERETEHRKRKEKLEIGIILTLIGNIVAWAFAAT